MTMSSTAPGNRSLDQIERDVHAERSRVADTIDALQDNLSFGKVIENVVSSVSRNSGDVGRNLAQSVKSNPMPVILTGIGLAWLMASSGRSAQRGYDMESDYRDADSFDDRIEHVALGDGHARVHGRGHGIDNLTPMKAVPESNGDSNRGDRPEPRLEAAKDRIFDAKEGVGDAVDRVLGAASDVAENANDGLSKAADAIKSAGEHARAQAKQVRWRARHVRQRAQHGFNDMLTEQPLVMGAVALAVGAALGGALPRTRVEDELVGEHSDRFKSRVGEIAIEKAAQAKAIGGAVLDEARAIADDAAARLDGATPAGSEIVEEAKQKTDEAAKRLRAAAADEAEKQGLIDKPKCPPS